MAPRSHGRGSAAALHIPCSMGFGPSISCGSMAPSAHRSRRPTGVRSSSKTTGRSCSGGGTTRRSLWRRALPLDSRVPTQPVTLTRYCHCSRISTVRIRIAVVVALVVFALAALRPANRAPVNPRRHSSSSGQLAGRPEPPSAVSAIVSAAVAGTTTAQTLAIGDRPCGLSAPRSTGASEDSPLPASSRPVIQRNLPLLI